MGRKVRVILITDGDRVAQHAVEAIGHSLGLRTISASGGNPTPIGGEEIVRLIKQAAYDPVLVMFDDRGRRDKGRGEAALQHVASHPDIEVLGAVAVASNTDGTLGVHPDLCVTADGCLSERAVDKHGRELRPPRPVGVITGDTVDVLNEVNVPMIVGIGDVGKMDKADDIGVGAPVTRRAIEEILKRNGVEYTGRQAGQ